MPLATAGMCMLRRILFHVCVRVSVIFVALPHQEWKSVILFGGDFLLQSRWEDTCWLCVVITLYCCKCIPPLFWTSCLKGQSEPSTPEDSTDTPRGQPGQGCEVGRSALFYGDNGTSYELDYHNLTFSAVPKQESCTHRVTYVTHYILSIFSQCNHNFPTQAQDKMTSDSKSVCC